ncbi:MAG: MBL fold metallo-hydrolase [Oscillospiraceae bacterium]|nr:MBL fold metallo-hydrolase [Oscillospiraceae bacterium]
MKKLIKLLTAALILFSGCSTENTLYEEIINSENFKTDFLSETTAQENIKETEADVNGEEAATLLYMGQASIRIVTVENKVIYIDPYAGDSYDLPADLILVTHAHFDHNQISKVENRNPDCIIITQDEALENGEHQIFDLGYVTLEAVEAGYNDWHDITDSVGYILTFSSNGRSVYVTGDTSATEQMPLLAEKEIDYAFFCCDGVFNMGLEEAAWCAEQVNAKHNIPYHMTTNTENNGFDRSIAERFEAENLLIIEDGEEIKIV